MTQDITVNVSIDVPSLDAGLSFYQGVFGFEEVARPFATMAVLNAGNVSMCIHAKAEGTESSPTKGEIRRYARHWTPIHLDFHVERLMPMVEKIKEAGGQVEQLLLDMGPRPVAFCADPFGNGFCVIAKSG